tara:strand:- start:315 stop:575 length:261 start_codon:yes stop_codon:yes gene_type:complete
MIDNQKKYLDRVISLLVRDTIIKNGGIHPPFLHPLFYPYFSPSLSLPFPSLFSKYCKNTYGLSEIEMEYVWIEYTNIIKHKIGYER